MSIKFKQIEDVIVYPGDGNSPEKSKNSMYYLGDTVGALPAAEVGVELVVSIVQAADQATADAAEQAGDPVGTKVSYYQGIDHGQGNGPVWEMTEVGSDEGLRGTPVATIADLTLLIARDDEHRKVIGGSSYVFTLGGTVADASDVAHTTPAGVWRVDRVVGEVASDRIGSLLQVSPLDETGAAITSDAFLARGILALEPGYTAVNGALNNPKAANMWPSIVVGNDFVVPADMGGAFSRNLDGNAAAFGVFQDDGTAKNGLRTNNHNHSIPNPNTWSHFVGPENALQSWQNAPGQPAANTGTVGDILANGDIETRPKNFSIRYGIILDSYSSRLLVESIAATVTHDELLPVPDRTQDKVLSNEALGKIVDKFTALGGQYSGEAATFAALPTTIAGTVPAEPVTDGDWAKLTADFIGGGDVLNPDYEKGVYRRLAGVWTFEGAFPRSEFVAVYNTVNDLPDPGTVLVGNLGAVVNDGTGNGLYVAMGSGVGGLALGWVA